MRPSRLYQRRTKIVCTIGPATSSTEMGVMVAREISVLIPAGEGAPGAEGDHQKV